MKITILSHTEITKAIVDDGPKEITATYYRRRTSNSGQRWEYLRTSTVAGPLHLALNMIHAIVNA